MLGLALIPLLAACPEPQPDMRPPTEQPAAEVRPEPRVAPAPERDLPAMAITVDDLPWVGPLPPGMSRLEATDSILAALAAHDATATAFVNCDRVPPGAPVLRRWLQAGHQLGNHTSGHLDLNRADPAAWAADAMSCDAFLRELTGHDAIPFRYPYLHRGHTVERYRVGRETIDAMSAPVAPVTIESLDWVMNNDYVAALQAGDQARARTIADAYIDHILRASSHYQQVAGERLGRDVAHIILLHANALLAHNLRHLLRLLAQEGFRFITLEAALRDPVYHLDDDYLGPLGISWLYRIPPAAPELFQWDRAERDRLRALAR